MSLKGRGQGVDLGTSTLSFMRSIICSLFGRDFPYDPLNLFPFFVFLSPRPHNIGAATPEETEGVSDDAPLINHLAATVHRCIALAAPLAILFFFVICCSRFGSCVLSTTAHALDSLYGPSPFFKNIQYIPTSFKYTPYFLGVAYDYFNHFISLG
jgi:hypothetical protein